METVFLAHPVLLFLLGTIVGLVSGLFGVGGGFLLTPLLHVVFHVPFNLAVGTGMAAITVGTASGAVAHWRQGDVHWPVAAVIALFGTATVGLGVKAVELLKGAAPPASSGVTAVDLWISVTYMLVLGAIGVAMMHEARAALRREPRDGYVVTSVNQALRRCRVYPCCTLPPPVSERVSLWPVAGLGALGGALGGFLGIGGGPFVVSALIYGLGLPTRYAAGSTLVGVVWIVILGAAQHWAKGNVSLASAAVLAVAAALGAAVGARLCCFFRGALIREWFAAVVLLTALSVALKLYIGLQGGGH